MMKQYPLWKLQTVMENYSVTIRNNLNESKVILGLSGNGTLLIQYCDEYGNPYCTHIMPTSRVHFNTVWLKTTLLQWWNTHYPNVYVSHN